MNSTSSRSSAVAGPAKIMQFRRGEIIRREGAALPQLYALHRGWVASSIDTGADGRQILRVHLPGEWLGAPSLALLCAHDTLTALSAVELHVIPAATLAQVFEDDPRRAATLFITAQRERVLALDRLTSIGRSDAQGRLAALILEFRDRAMLGGARSDRVFDLPLTQRDVGDLVGLTSVHVSRVLTGFRQDGIVSWSNGMVTILDEARLRALSPLPVREFVSEPAWLN